MRFGLRFGFFNFDFFKFSLLVGFFFVWTLRFKATQGLSILQPSTLTSSIPSQRQNSLNNVNNKNTNKLNININNNNNKNRKIKSNKFDPLWYLNKFGYLDKRSSSSSKRGSLVMYPPGLNMGRTLQNDASLTAALKLFQKYAKLNQTGVLDEPTLRIMKMPRCGHPDFFDDGGRFLLLNNASLPIRFRSRRYALQGSKWPKSKLRFKVGKYPKYPSMTHEMIDSELKRAFDLWSEVSDVEFEQVRDVIKPSFMDLLIFDEATLTTRRDDLADIEIRFETGYHGDSEPFDGSGLILGTRIYIFEEHALYSIFI